MTEHEAMSGDVRRAIEADCRDLAIRSIMLGDAQEWETLTDLFTEDAVFVRPVAPDDPIKGRQAILAQYKARPISRVTRHFATNVVIDVEGGDKARAILYVLLISGTAETDPPKFPIKADPALLVGEFRDDYVLTEGGWRIAKRVGSMIFAGA
jgi:ketosteroid isomerase-like protein